MARPCRFLEVILNIWLLYEEIVSHWGTLRRRRTRSALSLKGSHSPVLRVIIVIIVVYRHE